ncbi:ferritin-like domain-containing protein [Pararobbsia silviterrae]|uniref:Ferritin-like domain-containing protein n=1 Tax=Pararobbsia silviterrae TaxID=1792498 RepID=A0A494YAB6_9BURK|nr:ferritin-like domain-containing protein [Pararobbsia silviterrae]RKP57575.1 ferritin-like domain-containing protein [Pararobbsia silviterrae]
MSDVLLQGQADHAMRNWSHPDPGHIKIGSRAHLEMFCDMLLETHNPYKPAVIDWPALSPDALERVTSLPIWDMAVQKEGSASISVETFAKTIDDPLLRRALEMDGNEELRHKAVLSKLVEAYGITLSPEPDYPPPTDPEWGWMAIGYGECIDSFFAFGLFEVARRSGYFPPELVETFEPVIQEEGRHILFFVNWAAWYRRNMPWWRRPWFALKTAAVWVHLVRERIGIAKGVDKDAVAGDAKQDTNFTVSGTGAVGDALGLAQMIDLCLEENARRMAGYDTRLLRPRIVPFLARVVRKFVR